MIEAIGILASCFVLLSFIFRKTIVIRSVNIIGATLFVVYGISIGALSVWLLNGILIIIHVFHIAKERRKKGTNEN